MAYLRDFSVNAFHVHTETYLPRVTRPFPVRDILKAIRAEVGWVCLARLLMPSLQVLISTGHRKVQTNAMKACRMNVCKTLVKQRQYIFPHYHLGHVSPGHPPVVGVCMCRVSPCLRPSFASHMRRRAVGVVVVLLLLLSGDVETNPGPVGEVLC